MPLLTTASLHQCLHKLTFLVKLWNFAYCFVSGLFRGPKKSMQPQPCGVAHPDPFSPNEVRRQGKTSYNRFALPDTIVQVYPKNSLRPNIHLLMSITGFFPWTVVGSFCFTSRALSETLWQKEVLPEKNLLIEYKWCFRMKTKLMCLQLFWYFSTLLFKDAWRIVIWDSHGSCIKVELLSMKSALVKKI